LPGELNALQAIATLFAKVQALIVAEEQLLYLAGHDDLTGLLNRRLAVSNLADRLINGQPGPVPLFFLDLDRLKVISDYLGYDAGDQFLTAFADLLREAVDAEALIARFGGDEFIVVPAESMEAPAAEASARALHERLLKPIVIGGEVLTRPVSIGVAVGVPGRDSSSDVLRRANQAMLFAKSSGGGMVSAFAPEMSENYAIRNDIELHLERTIASGHEALILNYLPEFDIHTGEMLAAEALLRWQHPTRGLLMPESFIGIVESIHLAAKLGRLVMRSACAQVRMWDEHGVGGALLRVNVSPAQLVTDGFADTVAATLDEFGLDASRLCLEITEGVLVRDFDGTRKTFAELKDVGVQIAIDDFGTGYSGLTYLKSLPVDTLKIDKGFVRDLGTNEGDLAIVRSIMALADAFGLDVVAEGVETPAAAKTLLDLGCRRAQGFLLSRPLDGVAMEQLLAGRFIELDFLR
jgi:diguanylate cyclase (GGDEF)-like protein